MNAPDDHLGAVEWCDCCSECQGLNGAHFANCTVAFPEGSRVEDEDDERQDR